MTVNDKKGRLGVPYVIKRGGTVISVEPASGTDFGATTYLKNPGRLRRLARKLKLDKSTWEWKVVKHEIDTKPLKEEPLL